LLAWVPLGGRIAPANDAGEKKLEATVKPLLDHPALVVWEVPDEALWNVGYGRQGKLATERTKLRKLMRERERGGHDVSRVQALLAEEARLRARADFEAAEAREREIRRLLGADKQDPDIQMSTAPEAAEQMRQRLLRGCRLVNRLDGRPVWMNYAPRNTLDDLRRYAEAADIVGCDIYPVPVEHSQGHSDLVNRRLFSVGDYTERFHQAGGGRPVWMVLQGFGWRDIHKHPPDAPEEKGRRPSRAESRFMLYDAIVHGARGVLYWGCNYAQEPPDFWRDLRAVVREAADLGEVWAARDAAIHPEVSYGPTWGSVDRPPLALAKNHEDKTYILVVNEHYEGLAVRLSGLRGLDGARVSLVGNPSGCALKTDRIEQGALTHYMAGLSAAVVAVSDAKSGD